MIDFIKQPHYPDKLDSCNFVEARGWEQRERGEAMGFKKKSGLLVGAGLLGTVGVRRDQHHRQKCYVQGVAQGLRAKATYEARRTGEGRG
ncbi:MAG: hypothetical protein ACLT98_08550 [Eggerthellaceae bacterium]